MGPTRDGEESVVPLPVGEEVGGWLGSKTPPYVVVVAAEPGLVLEGGEAVEGGERVRGATEHGTLAPDVACWVWLSAWGWPPRKGSTPRGEAPRPPLGRPVVGVPAACEWESSPGPALGVWRAESLPYRARCWRAIKSRRLSSVMAAGLMDRSDLSPEMSARRPFSRRKQSQGKQR